MEKRRGWSIDIADCSSETLLDLTKQLKGSEHKAQLLEIQCELINRVRKTGATDQEIINMLIRNVWKGDRVALAKEWGGALGMSEDEFMRIANVK